MNLTEEIYNDDFDDQPVDIKSNHRNNTDPENNSNSILNILKQSAMIVDKEDKEKTTKILETASTSIREQVIAESPVHRSNMIDNKNIDPTHLDRISIQETPPDRIKPVTRYRIEEEENRLEDNNNNDDDDDEDQDSIHPIAIGNVIKFLASVFRGEMKEIQNYIREGEVSIICRDRHGWTALHWAASSGQHEILSLILETIERQGKRVSKYINQKEHITGWTPLHIACIHCHVHAIKTLLSFGAKRDIPNQILEYPVDCIGSYRYAHDVHDLVEIRDYDDAYISARRFTEEYKENI